MFQISLLGSGSSGNCALIESRGCRLLVDGGLSARQITLRLASLGVDPISLDGILLTHEHTDHVGGLRVLCKKTPIPVYCTRLTAEALHKTHLAEHPNIRKFEAGAEFTIKDIGIRTFPVPHDAVDPVGFTFFNEDESLGFLTDLGKVTHAARERVRGVSTLVIETNHDEKKLQDDPHRPWSLKQRIMSIHGHLSNVAAAAMLGELLGDGLNRAILCHLSRDCNTPELALGAVRERLAADGAQGEVEVYCASQTEVTPRFLVRKRASQRVLPLEGV